MVGISISLLDVGSRASRGDSDVGGGRLAMKPLAVGEIVALGPRAVRICGMPDGLTICRDGRRRIAVRNMETDRLSYVPEWRLFRGRYTRGMAKRGYSREFTPRTDRRIRFEIDRIPPGLFDAVKSRAKREGVSLRALTLRLWKDWSERPESA